MKMSISKKRSTLKAYDIAGHIVELVENNIVYQKKYLSDLWEFEYHLHSTFYNSDIYLQLPFEQRKSLLIKYLIVGGFCEFKFNITNERLYEPCFENYFETYVDLVRSRINDQYYIEYKIKIKKYYDFYFLSETSMSNSYLGEKGRFNNKSNLINILNIAKSLKQEYEIDKIYKWESVKEIAQVIANNGFITFEEAKNIIRRSKLKEFE